MKLRNKKTGEIGKLYCDMNVSPAKYGVFEDTDIRGHYWEYHSLAKLNEEWEDYEEPKGYWYIRDGGNIDHNLYGKSIINRHKEIGNYFNTFSEAEKAVEKLKAWKRLKDIGCDFDGWNIKTAGSEGDHLLIHLHIRDCTGCEELLDLLFGGEE